jgi:hypothetical protein
MPPRKSDVSKAGTGDEATAAKEALVRDGINIEVYVPIPLSLTRPVRGCEDLQVVFQSQDMNSDSIDRI